MENKGESDHVLETLENLEVLEILDILEIPPVKRPFRNDLVSDPETPDYILECPLYRIGVASVWYRSIEACKL